MFDPNLPNPRLPKPFRVEPLEPYALDESYIVQHPHKDLDRRRHPRSAKYSDSMSRDYFDCDPYDYEDEKFFCRGRHYGGYCDDDYRGRGSIFDKIRSVNREVASINKSIIKPSMSIQLHPMMTPNGYYPRLFKAPTLLADFVNFSDREVEEILADYDIDVPNSWRYRCSAHGYSGGIRPRLRNLYYLLQFLGAHQLAEEIKYAYSRRNMDELRRYAPRALTYYV